MSLGRTFRRHGGGIRASFSAPEVRLLRALREELVALLHDDEPDDPVTQRLFPTAVLDDEDANAEVKSLLRQDLLEDRIAALDTLLTILDRAKPARGALRVDLRDDEPLVILGVLNDVRLALGARIDIEALDRQSLTEDDAVISSLAIMDLLAWWQEQLLSIIDPAAVAASDDMWPDDE